ncbi:MAG TPA: hypothetical protein VHE61_18025 [Opitutaceae bacterium]|nr:hypothetical protein [Opitutaceae bacterium]
MVWRYLKYSLCLAAAVLYAAVAYSTLKTHTWPLIASHQLWPLTPETAGILLGSLLICVVTTWLVYRLVTSFRHHR